MNSELLDSVAARWAKLGAMLNVRAGDKTPDIERLLLDTARVSSANSRLFIMAATWLARYGAYVAKHRLARLILDELESEYRPTLGLLLEWAKDHGESNGSRFNLAIKACGSAKDGRPLSDVENRNIIFARLAKQRASVLSQKWGRWMTDFEPKNDALRPVSWVAEHNDLAVRALTGGDLRSSVMAEYEAGADCIESEAELARRCGASRPAIRGAIECLKMAGYVQSSRKGRCHPIARKPRIVARVALTSPEGTPRRL